jgi:hypothetical protein
MERPKETQAPEAPSPTTASNDDKKPGSVVDTIFDALTERAAQGLVAAKRALEASARWLEAQAKVVGDLATKLSTPKSETSV